MDNEPQKEVRQIEPNSEQEAYDPFFQEDEELEDKKEKIIEENTKAKDKKQQNGLNEAKIKSGLSKNAGTKGDVQKSLKADVYSKDKKNHGQYTNHLKAGANHNEGVEVVSVKGKYPELMSRSDKESELLVHFYVKNISSSSQKNDVYGRLYDTIQYYGGIKEIAFRRISSDIFEFSVGMKYDSDAKYIIDNDKLRSYLTSLDKGDVKPYLQISRAFNLNLGNLKEKDDLDHKKEKEHYKDRDRNREKESANKDRDYDKRHHNYSPTHSKKEQILGKNDTSSNERPPHSGNHHRNLDTRSRSRSRSKSPSGLRQNTSTSKSSVEEKHREYDPNRPYQVKDFLSDLKSAQTGLGQNGQLSSSIPEKTDMKPDIETIQQNGAMFHHLNAPLRVGQGSGEKILNPNQRPEKPPMPTTNPQQSSANEYTPPPSKEGIVKNHSGQNSFYAPPPSMPDQSTKAPPKPASSHIESMKSSKQDQQPHPQHPAQSTIQQPVQTIEQNTEYEKYCLLLGLPLEILDRHVLTALKTQNIETPLECDWVEEGVIKYLRLRFTSEKTVKDLILMEFNVGPTPEDLIYPVMVLPWIRDMKINDLLTYHQVQVESSIAVDSLFLQLFYSPYGPLIDVIDMKPYTHVLIFAKQPHAQYVTDIPQICLQKGNIEVVMKHSPVDYCYPLVRKNLQSHLKTIVTNYMKKIEKQHPELEEVKELPLPQLQQQQQQQLSVPSQQHPQQSAALPQQKQLVAPQLQQPVAPQQQQPAVPQQQQQPVAFLQQQQPLPSEQPPTLLQQQPAQLIQQPRSGVPLPQQQPQVVYVSSPQKMYGEYPENKGHIKKGYINDQQYDNGMNAGYYKNPRFNEDEPYSSNDRGSRGHFGGHNNRQDRYSYNNDRGGRGNFYQDKRKDNMRNDRYQNYNQRSGQIVRDGGAGPMNRASNYNQYRNQSDRGQVQYQQDDTLDPKQQYYGSRNLDPRSQERVPDYRSQQLKTPSQQQQPNYH